jgi:hypothetical protein
MDDAAQLCNRIVNIVQMPCWTRDLDLLRDSGVVSFALTGLAIVPDLSHGLRRGLRSFAASRLLLACFLARSDVALSHVDGFIYQTLVVFVGAG